eukprot:c14820_g1_i1.p1 GENE.c14820_g1_i1~~c14820_g1_i1.p1  ORF type:complete len:194 (+),score=35.79 c14820_g1_i1:116-697(+)
MVANPRLVIASLAFTMLFMATAASVHAMIYSDILPSRVPSHFNGEGHPNGWSTRGEIIGAYMGIEWGNSLLFMIIAALMRYIPASAMNLGPYKAEWIASPLAMKEARVFLMSWSFATGALTNLFVICVYQLNFSAAMEGTSLSPLFAAAFIVYLVCVLAGVIALVWKFFRRPTWVHEDDEGRGGKGPGLASFR